jgi:hypothetical protein
MCMCSPPRLTTGTLAYTSHCHAYCKRNAKIAAKSASPARRTPHCLSPNTDRTGLFDTVKHPANMVLEHEF